ncbi:putative transmembrane protein [Rhizoctonia solani 123E]|uniref:Putative transmembrane protein n=1 Tax=Rhizoctonia solani 123E TaxID=1423351 RepID=A0A074S621_9AGAM|nr:putative transmembrane protein [Rhizoctonia solani 123E]
MIRSPLARLLAISFILLSFTLLVWSAPVEAGKNLIARGGTCAIGCTTGNQVYTILINLKAALAIKLALLDGCYYNGTDPTSVVADIVALINAATASILACPKDLLGLLNGKILVIVNLCVSIVIDIASHCGKWSDKPKYDVFLTLIVVIDVALKGLLSACGGLLGTLLGLIAGLLGGVNIALLLKVKFKLCLGILGL